MPLLRIDLAEGRDREQIRSIVDATHRAVVSVLGIPERDRFQIVHEHPAEHIIAQDAGLGFERGNVVMIQIFTQRGRTRQAKQELFRAIADALAGRDAQAAVDAVREHLETTLQTMKQPHLQSYRLAKELR